MTLSSKIWATLAAPRAPQVYLHIGAMKTGTTYLQELMEANRDRLARHGFLFPGTDWIEQDRAARDVLGFSAADARLASQSRGKWAQLAEQMLAHRGRGSLFSMEFLSFADADQAARVVRSLDGADVHVILTVRDAARNIPAQWQTTCRNGGKVAWPQFLTGVEQSLESDQPSSRAARSFQRTQGIPRMLGVWVPLVGAERVHVVTVPPKGTDPRVLWERFAEAVGAPKRACRGEPDYSNVSLGHASSELLRRVNVALGPVARSDYDRVLKGPIARGVLGARARTERPVTLNRRGHRLAARWNRRVLHAVDTHGVHLVGDAGDLPTAVPDGAPRGPVEQPSDTDLLAAAQAAREGLWRHLGVLDRQVRRAALEPPTPEGPDGPPTPGGPPTVDDAVAELAVLARRCFARLHALDRARGFVDA